MPNKSSIIIDRTAKAFTPLKTGLFLTGFTFLEIIISMLILSLVTAGIFGLFMSGNKFIYEAGRRLQAVNYAQMIAEQLKVYVSADTSITALNAGQHNPGDAGITLMPGQAIFGAEDQSCVYTVNAAPPQGTLGLKEVTVTLSWTEP